MGFSGHIALFRDEIASSHCLPRLGTTPTATRLQQEFASSEMGSRRQFAEQQFSRPWSPGNGERDIHERKA
jgi:hypothetical protein